MDANRFDDLSIAMAEGTSRRGLLRLLVGSGLAIGAAAGRGIGLEEADANASRKACRQKCKRKNRKEQRRRCRQRCKKQSSCKRNPQCVDPQICVNGDCTGGWACVTDSQCLAGQTCVAGRCTGGGACKNDKHCRSGQVCVAGTCQGPVCPAVTRTACANEPATCGPEGSTCACLQEASGGSGRIACSEVGFADCNATPVCDPARPNDCPAGWLCASNPCCPESPRCLPPCGTLPQIAR